MEFAQEEFAHCMDVILEGGRHFPQNEQKFIKAWTVKLIELRDEQDVELRNEYSRSLAGLINVEKRLAPPFNSLPPEGPLVPLSDLPDNSLAVAAEHSFGGRNISESEGDTAPDSEPERGTAVPTAGGVRENRDRDRVRDSSDRSERGRGRDSNDRSDRVRGRDSSDRSDRGRGRDSSDRDRGRDSSDRERDRDRDRGAASDVEGGGTSDAEGAGTSDVEGAGTSDVEGVTSEGIGSEGPGSEGIGSEGALGSEGVGSENVGSEGQHPKYVYTKMPCARKPTGAIPKGRKISKTVASYDPFQYFNEYEDHEEIVKALARSKGQSFAEFIAAVSRHTRDFGQGLRSAMKAETSSFRDYVDNVLSQRIKDLTEVLDEEQNRVLQGVKRDIEKWQIELCNVKKRIKEIIPTFDIDLYRKDKNYIRKLFAINVAGVMPEEDSFTRFSEESADRLKWIQEMINNIMSSNEQTVRDLTDFRCKAMEFKARESSKQQQLRASLNCELQTYKHLKQERDRLFRENNELLSQLEEFNA